MTDPIFQRSLQDLIKGIRSHTKDSSVFISHSIAEIKSELKSKDPFTKAEAMVGYNVSWASFAIVEVMSQPRFAHKRIGYLAANQSFDESTDVILLTVNLFKKEFSNLNNNQYEIGLAINCLANIGSADVARGCISDVVNLMNHSQPYVRKKAVLAMFKLYVKFPQGLRITFDKLKERLEDSDSSVVSTAVNVVCELANKNPKNYLSMAPQFFKLLTTSNNNWMLIKVVKLLGALVSEEPRLARKLLDPLASIVQSTGAKSLQYECIATMTEALPYSKREDGSDAKNAAVVIKLCSDYLKEFIEDNDQNLKYLGLVGLVRLMKSHPRSVVDHSETVLKCLNDEDVNIRRKSLELLAGIVSSKSLIDLVHHLMHHARVAEGVYRDEVITTILSMCKKDKFSLVNDFPWYVSILVELAMMHGSSHGEEVASQIIEVALRVETVRPFAVESMLTLLFNQTLFNSQAHITVAEVMRAAAWIVGEYSEVVTAIADDDLEPDDESIDSDIDDEEGYWIEGAQGEEIRSEWRGQDVHSMIIKILLHPRSIELPIHVQRVFLQSIMKVFVRASLDCQEGTIAEIVRVIRERMFAFVQSPDLEVQERTSSFQYLLDELEVLPLNWIELIESEETPSEKKKKSRKEDLIDTEELNLLDLSETLTVTALDTKGAKNAIVKKHILGTILSEKFYAVHPKAQKKVPIPEEFNLEKNFNGSAMRELLAFEVENSISISSVSFVAVPPPIESDLYRNEHDFKVSKSLTSGFAAESSREDKMLTPIPPVSDMQSIHTGTTTSRNSDDVFYLSNNNSTTTDVIPLSKILGDNFVDTVNDKKSQTKSTRSRKVSKKKDRGVDMTELLPAGGMSLVKDDEDDEDAKNKKSRRRTRMKRGANKEYEDGLEAVDLTSPLREDEILVQPTHRVVPEYVLSESIADVSSGNKEKNKTKKKDRSEKKHKSSKKSSIQEENLLGLDNVVSNNLLAVDNRDSTSNGVSKIDRVSHIDDDSNGKSAKKNKSKSSDKKKSSSTAWLPLYCDDHIDVLHSIEANMELQTITIQTKVINNRSDGFPVSVIMEIQPSTSYQVKVSNRLSIADKLACGENSKLSIDLTTVSNVITGSIPLAGDLIIMNDSLLGSEKVSKPFDTSITICSTLTPNKVSEESFMAAVGKPSSRWENTTAQITTATKPKSAFKTLAAIFNAAIVETESSKAANMTAKVKNGSIKGTIYFLVKAVSDGISIDIKCLCGSKEHSATVANLVSDFIKLLEI